MLRTYNYVAFAWSHVLTIKRYQIVDKDPKTLIATLNETRLLKYNFDISLIIYIREVFYIVKQA